MASPELKTVLQQMAERQAEQAANPPGSIIDMRKNMEANAAPLTAEGSYAPVDANGVPAEWVWVPGADTNRRVLYFHGGGYLIGSPITHRRLCEDISRASGCVVLNVDYRMAPENPFPAAVDDGVETLEYIWENGPRGPVAAASVFVGGDSAGGGLTLATLLAARDRGVRLPDAAVCISAWTDLAISGPTIESRKDQDPLIRDPAMIQNMASQYLNGADPLTPLASPLYADPAGLPPLLMQVGDAEVLLSDTTRFAEKARAAGVDVTEEVWPEMFHVWHQFAPVLPEGQQAVARIGEFVKAHITAPASGD